MPLVSQRLTYQALSIQALEQLSKGHVDCEVTRSALIRSLSYRRYRNVFKKRVHLSGFLNQHAGVSAVFCWRQLHLLRNPRKAE